jgi:hypothetical protein
MRLPNNRKELALVSRGRVEKGMDRFRPPRHYETKQFWTWLHKYLSTMDDVLEELKPIVERVAVDNTVIVLVCNLGQSELLANFVCSSRARGFDLGRVLLFATDEETKELAEGLGITAFYDHRVRATSLVRIEAFPTMAPTFGNTHVLLVLLVFLSCRTSPRRPKRPPASTATSDSLP